MPTRPAPPQSLPELVEAFAQTGSAVLELARSCSDQDLAKTTECPGWTVHDQISHVVGVEAWLAGHQDPRVEMPRYEHIRNDLGKKVEYAVEVRRGRTGAQVLAELERVLSQRLSTLRDPGLTDDSIIAGPFGPDQATTVMRLRTFDVWTHEQDLRCALGRPGNLDSPAAAHVVSSVLDQLPKLIARGEALAPADCVFVDVTGPAPAVTARQGVRVELDEQGRLRGYAMVTGEAEDAVSWYVAGESMPTSDGQPAWPTTLSISTEAFTRRAAGRRSERDTAYTVVGDEGIARHVMEALVITR